MRGSIFYAAAALAQAMLPIKGRWFAELFQLAYNPML
jgi:hypothetical protein